MIVARGETYELARFPRVENSPYEYEDAPDIVFFGRPANTLEKKVYRIQQGVNGNSDSIMVYATNLPAEIKPNDKIRFMGKEWSVASIGYYFDSNRIVTARIFDDDYLFKRSPKGLVLQ